MKTSTLRSTFFAVAIPTLISLAASYWLISGLGNGMLWQDEAQTALLGRTTAHYGLPLAFDGANSLSQERGDDYGPHRLWKWHMWLPFYVLAGFFKVFGESTALARLPFAILGVCTVVLSYYTALALWKDRTTALIAALYLLTCVPFALLVRQCRYYSFAMFFSLLMLYAYIKICDGWRRGWILLSFAAVLLFNSHFMYCATAFAAIAVHCAVWHRSRWRSLTASIAVTAVLCAPPVIWLATLNYRNYAHGVINTHFLWVQLRTYGKHIFVNIVPYPMLLLPIAIGIKRMLHGKPWILPVQDLAPWALPILFSLFTWLAVSPFTPWPFFRYLGPIVVPLILVAARWIRISFDASAILGAGALLLIGLWWPDANYLYELNHRFAGPVEGIVELLNKQGRPGDAVVTSYEDLPIKFYTKYRVFAGLTGEDLAPAKGARWLILRRFETSDHEDPVRIFIANQIQSDPSYQPIKLDVSDTPFENREEPDIHQYSSVIGMPPVVVWERKPSETKKP